MPQRRYHGQLDAPADEFIAHAVDGATRMQKLIEDLLACSRVGTPGATQELASCATALDQALKRLSVVLQESHAQINRDAPPVVMGIPTQLALLPHRQRGQISATRSTGTDRHRRRREGDEWIVSVKDNGIGIDSQYFERIFMIFQRLRWRAEYPGTRIGLALCKRIVEQHGGRIWVESGPDGESTFFFTLNAKLDGSARQCCHRLRAIPCTSF
ncbi:light-regulated signal transduction histidine kinase (bacteriophytochrome) [Paraburkholderia youngii]